MRSPPPPHRPRVAVTRHPTDQPSVLQATASNPASLQHHFPVSTTRDAYDSCTSRLRHLVSVSLAGERPRSGMALRHNVHSDPLRQPVSKALKTGTQTQCAPRPRCVSQTGKETHTKTKRHSDTVCTHIRCVS